MAKAIHFLCISWLALLAICSGSGESAVLQSTQVQQAHEPQRLDLYGDPLPPGAVLRFGTVRWQAPGRTFAFSPDGRRILASFGDDVHVLDAQTGEQFATVRLQRPQEFEKLPLFDQVRARATMSEVASFSKDCKTLATLGGRKIRFWDVATGKLQREFPAHVVRPASFLWSPDGSTLAAASSDMSFHMWDAATGKERNLRDNDNRRLSNAFGEFSADSRVFLASVGGKVLRSYDVRTSRLICETKTDSRALAISPDGKIIASLTPDGLEIHLWNGDTGKTLRSIRIGPGEVVEDVEFSPDGKLLVLRQQEKMLLWDLHKDKVQRTFPFTASDWSLAWFGVSPDGSKLALCPFGWSCVHMWDATTGQELSASAGRNSWVDHVTVSPDGKTLASICRSDSSVSLWDTTAGKRLRSIKLPGQSVAPPAFSEDGKLLVTCESPNLIRVWDTANAKSTGHFFASEWKLTGGHEALSNISIETNSVAGAAKVEAENAQPGTRQHQTSIYVWDEASGKVLVQRQISEAEYLCFSADNRLLAHEVEGRTIGTEPNGGIRSSRDRGRVTWSLVVEELATGRSLFSIDSNFIIHLQFSRDGRSLACLRHTGRTAKGSEELEICVWEVATGKKRIGFPTTGMFSWSSDARLFATLEMSLDMAGFRVWSVPACKEIFDRQIAKRFIPSYSNPAFSPDNGRLFIGMDDSTVLAWEVPTKSQGNVPNGRRLDRNSLSHSWQDLASSDAAKAYQAIWMLIDAPEQSVPVIKEHLHPTKAAEMKQILKLIADIDHSKFAVREAAAKEMQNRSFDAEKALCAALQKNPSPETRRRIEQILAHPTADAPPAAIAQLRAIEVLEHIGNADARKLLEWMATGAPGARLTEEAKGSLVRLALRK
jgi:WD40 repeat protein